MVALAVGVGLVGAPFAFQMFTRAPEGGDMIDAFEPFMRDARIEAFQAQMGVIDAAVAEAGTQLDGSQQQDRSTAELLRQWPSIDADMSDMLATMRDDVPKYRAVAALPPFPLFPWFFVAPGVLVAVSSLWGIVRASQGRSTRGPSATLIGLGLAIVAAPAVFQMFTRAPRGESMIDDFRPLMQTAKVQQVQGYFLVIGAGEGSLRNRVLPAVAAERGVSAAQLADQLPALTRFAQEWPQISNDMAPMIGAMSDNVGNFAAVDALPPFGWFPWFFVVPGGLVALGGALAFRGPQPTDQEQ